MSGRVLGHQGRGPQWLVLVAAALLSCTPAHTACDHTLSRTQSLVVESTLKCQGEFAACTCKRRATPQEYVLQLTVTAPDRGAWCSEPDGSPSTVFFFHGFGGKFVLSARNYLDYAVALAEAGNTVVQYDIERGAGPLETVPDMEELQFLGQIYAALDADPVTQLPSPIMLAGHSRGGKLAALHLAADTLPNTTAAFLIDPVDNPCFAPESPCYPSARKALQEAHSHIGVVGATIRGCCNPNTPHAGQPAACTLLGKPCTGHGAQDLYEAAEPPLELDFLSAGHMQFAQLGGIERLVANDLCGYNASADNAEVMRSTAELMLAWFAKHSSAPSGVMGEQVAAAQ